MIRFIGILYLFASMVTGVACEQAPPQQSTQTAKDPAVLEPAHENKETTESAWPQVESDEHIEVAQDLTAKNYYVVLDCSGSMGEVNCSNGLPKLEVAKTSLKNFADLVPRDANLGLLVFQENKIYEGIPLGKANRDQFKTAVDATFNSGATPLFSAIRQGYLQLEAQGKKQLGYGEYTIVVVTDGEASDGEDPTRIVSWILDYSPIQIHTIGFCIGPDHSLNIPGRTVYKAADNPQQLEEGLQEVLAESEAFDVSDFHQN
ncbi:vWA domain-containing protein [uncultured Desulfobacter sp.]|uniref:vWA domain-containing protein n=1 Tax=uncultured Desulfobacter sp. TaxID=240139 RepID=UPI002AAB332F|nr:vWA domain-containing protein [uncultured Desulfobacter sp.]